MVALAILGVLVRMINEVGLALSIRFTAPICLKVGDLEGHYFTFMISSNDFL